MTGSLKISCLIGISMMVMLGFHQEARAESRVAFYQDRFDVSKEEANDRLELQSFTVKLSNRLGRSVGSAVTSWHFDNDNGVFVVRVQSQAARDEVHAIATDLGISGEVHVELSKFDRQDLESEINDLEEILHDQISNQTARVGLANGFPLVELTRELAGDSALRGKLSRSKVPIEIKVRPVQDLEIAPQACVFPYCSTATGGTRFWAFGAHNRYGCTLGFVASDQNGAPVAITAGHCVDDIDQTWYTVQLCLSDQSCSTAGVGFNQDIRYFENGSTVTTDYAIFHLPPLGAWGLNALPSRFVDWRTSTQAPIRGYLAERPPTGITICKHGSSGGSSCGVVTSVNPTGLFIVTGACIVSGDSGGPWELPIWGSHVAVGTLVGGSDNCPGVAAVQPVHEPIEEFGLDLPY